MMETAWVVQPPAAAPSADAPEAAEALAALPPSGASAPGGGGGGGGLAAPVGERRSSSGGVSGGGRRRSWHIKMERKRRKGVFGSGGALGPTSDEAPRLLAAAERHKRPSWWNIFVPDHWPGHRSRRASQDLPRTSDGNALPWQRSKSRSVDHGFTAPFDLDSLRNKVEGRFASVDRLSRGDSDGSSKDDASERRSASKSTLLINTTTYTVSARDTLTSVAARFDTTPSELAEINRLATRLVFPGQALLVPLKEGASAPSTAPPVAPPPLRSASADAAAATAPAAAAADLALAPSEEAASERLGAGGGGGGGGSGVSGAEHGPAVPTTALPGTTTRESGPPPASECRFLKMNVRHITDGQGVVSGVLLVTPNAVMFDPNVSDPLVIEHGPESYGVIAPMEFVANAAIYHDIAHMRVSSVESAGVRVGGGSAGSGPRPEVYHPARARSPGKDSLLPKDETFPELQAAHAGGDDEDASSAGSSRDGDAFPKAFERGRVTPSPGARPASSAGGDDSGDGDADAASSRQVSLDSCPSPAPPHDAERRRSTLDQHWPQPSLDKGNGVEATAGDVGGAAGAEPALVKLSCHDSGIDIRDAGLTDAAVAAAAAPTAAPGSPAPIHAPAPAPSTVPAPTTAPAPPKDQGEKEPEVILPSKKVFSDADIILAPKTEWVPPVTSYNTVTGVNSTNHTSLTAPSGEGSRKKTSSVSFSLESNPESDSRDSEDSHKAEDSEKQESRKNKMLKRLSYPLAWMEGLTSEKDDKDVLTGLPGQQSAEAPDSHHSSVFSKVFSRRSSVGTFIRQPTTHSEKAAPAKPPAPKLDYRSMVSVEDMPELFVSFDKLIPRPARSCEDPPLYLRLRMGKPLNKKIPKSTPIMSYGKKKMRPEYWFSVPRNRVDELYQFLLAWVPHLYGDLDEVDPRARGYELVESDTELWEEDGGNGGPEGGRVRSPSGGGGGDADLGDLTRDSWEVLKAPYVKLYTILKTQTVSSEPEAAEVLSMSEELRRALYASSAGSLDLDPFVPELSGVTEVLTEEHRKQLCRHLPARAEGYVWTLVFSTSQHGFSLNSMYRKMSRLESPILLVIEDTDNNVFGALTSCSLKVSDHFYGTGESLLFRFSPEFQVFNWTGDNMYFIKGNNESLSIGAGDGKFGLWLDGDLYQGRTQSCSTYGNEPLAPQEDFVVKTLECWAFI